MSARPANVAAFHIDPIKVGLLPGGHSMQLQNVLQ